MHNLRLYAVKFHQYLFICQGGVALTRNMDPIDGSTDRVVHIHARKLCLREGVNNTQINWKQWDRDWTSANHIYRTL